MGARAWRMMSTAACTLGTLDVNGAATDASPSFTRGSSPSSRPSIMEAADRAPPAEAASAAGEKGCTPPNRRSRSASRRACSAANRSAAPFMAATVAHASPRWRCSSSSRYTF